ncbi:MAG: alpha/beta fold hydrolase [Thalassobaculaceae bacterium]|nr:alpha/beta fold hydrolase [Thalassobaculaceae bacterium]
MSELDGPRFGPANGGDADALVVMLHGLGADGNDLIGIAPVWAREMGSVAFASPHAPFPCDMAPYGRQWFSLQSRDPADMLAGIRVTAPQVNAYLDGELDRLGLGPEKLALVGFSQGTMTALYTALRRPAPIAGIVGYSGALIAGDLPDDPVTATPPVVLVHGTADEVVPFGAMQHAEATLTEAGLAVESVARPGLGHGIDEVGLGIGAAFLRRVLCL